MSDTEIDILIKGKNEAADALNGAKGDVDDLGNAGKDATGALGGLSGMLGGPIVAAAGAAAGALLAVGAAAFSMAQDSDEAIRTIQQQLGYTREEAEKLKPQIENLFTSGLVESATAGAQAIAAARQQFRGLADEELVNVAKKSLLISNTFGDEYSKVLNSANTLSQQFGISSDQALDLITSGYQRGLNASGDLLDSIGEYSNQWASAGASASEFFSAQETGLQGGVLGLDKMNDAFKEFNIRIKDGSDTTRDALNEVLAAQGIVDTQSADLTSTLDGLKASFTANEQAIGEAEAAYASSQAVVAGLTDQLSQARSELDALGGADLAGMRAYDDQLFALGQQANQVKRAMLDMVPDSGRIQALEADVQAATAALKENESALESAQGAYAASQQVVDDLSTALEAARSELDALGSPNLKGMQEIDDQLVDLKQQATTLRRAMLDMVPDAAHIQTLQRELDSATRAVDANAAALEDAEGVYATSQQAVDELRGALEAARRELTDMARPNLAGMEEYERKIFEVERQIKAAQLAMLGMDEQSPQFADAQKHLDQLNEQLERLGLERDLQFDEQLRAIEKAATGGQKPALTYAQALQEIADKKEEIAGLEGEFNQASGEMNANAAQVALLTSEHDRLAEAATRAQAALEAAQTPTAEYQAAAAQLAAINTEMDRLSLDREIQFEPQLRAIQAALSDSEPAVSYADALQAIADKKAEIAGLEGALGAATATMDANAATVEALSGQHDQLALAVDTTKAALDAAKAPTAEYQAAETALADLNTQMDRLALERDLQFEPQLRAIQTALSDTGQPALTVEQTLQAIGEKKAQISDLEGALAGAESQTAANRDRVEELKDQQEDLTAAIAATKAALENVVTPADELLQLLADGKITEMELFEIVQKGLLGMDDKVRQNKLGVALFGTQWEDSTAKALLGIDTQQTNLEDLIGAVNRLIEANRSIGSDWTEIKNQMLAALGPVGEELLKIVNEYMPEFKAAGLWLAEFLRDNLPGAIENTKTFLTDLREGVWVVEQGFKSASDGALYLRDKIEELKGWLAGLDDDLPDWLRPGSPTPFELGLKGIASEMGDLAQSELPRFAAGLDLATPLLPDLSGATGGVGATGAPALAGGINAPITVQGSVITERDLFAAWIDMLRQASRQNGGLAAMGVEL